MSWVRNAIDNIQALEYEKLHQTVFGGYGTKPDIFWALDPVDVPSNLQDKVEEAVKEEASSDATCAIIRIETLPAFDDEELRATGNPVASLKVFMGTRTCNVEYVRKINVFEDKRPTTPTQIPISRFKRFSVSLGLSDASALHKEAGRVSFAGPSASKPSWDRAESTIPGRRRASLYPGWIHHHNSSHEEEKPEAAKPPLEYVPGIRVSSLWSGQSAAGGPTVKTPSASPCASLKIPGQGQIEDLQEGTFSGRPPVENKPKAHAVPISAVTPNFQSDVQLWSDKELVSGNLKDMGMSGSLPEVTPLEEAVPPSPSSSGSQYDDAPERASDLALEGPHTKSSSSVLADNLRHLQIESHNTPAGSSPIPRPRDLSPCRQTQPQAHMPRPISVHSSARSRKTRSMYVMTSRDLPILQSGEEDQVDAEADSQPTIPMLVRARARKTLSLYGTAQIGNRSCEGMSTATVSKKAPDVGPWLGRRLLHPKLRKELPSGLTVPSETSQHPMPRESGIYSSPRPLTSGSPSGVPECAKSQRLSRFRRLSTHIVRLFR